MTDGETTCLPCQFFIDLDLYRNCALSNSCRWTLIESLHKLELLDGFLLRPMFVGHTHYDDDETTYCAKFEHLRR